MRRVAVSSNDAKRDGALNFSLRNHLAAGLSLHLVSVCGA
jgi:hypothetical protein